MGFSQSGALLAGVAFPKPRASAEREREVRKSSVARIVQPARKDVQRLKALWERRLSLERSPPEERRQERAVLRKIAQERPWVEHCLGAAPRRISLSAEEANFGPRGLMHVLERHVDDLFDGPDRVQTPRWLNADVAENAVNAYLEANWGVVTAELAGWGRSTGELDAKRRVGDYPLEGRTVPTFRFRVVVTAHLNLPERYVVTTAYPMHPRSFRKAPRE